MFCVFLVGIMQENGDAAFQKIMINRVFEHPKVRFESAIPQVFIAIDPNGGGDSRFAICSCFYRRGKMIIAGLDAVKSKKPAEYEPVLYEHIMAFRRHKNTSGARVVIMVENNLGFESYHIERFINKSNARKFCCFLTDKEQKVGLRTTNPIKESMWHKFKTFLEEDAVCVWEDMISVNPNTKPKDMLKQLREELNNYKVMIELPKTVFQETKRTFTGKLGGSIDDLSVTCQLNALCKYLVLNICFNYSLTVLFYCFIVLLFLKTGHTQVHNLYSYTVSSLRQIITNTIVLSNQGVLWSQVLGLSLRLYKNNLKKQFKKTIL